MVTKPKEKIQLKWKKLISRVSVGREGTGPIVSGRRKWDSAFRRGE